jgi:hypothetical protein
VSVGVTWLVRSECAVGETVVAAVHLPSVHLTAIHLSLEARL